jgi:CheY-like chemotaxis protein
MAIMPAPRNASHLRASRRQIVVSPPGGIFDYGGIGKSFILASLRAERKPGTFTFDPALATKKIMIVDDEEQIAKLYSLILSNIGFTVSDLEYDGSAAVDRIAADKDIDLLIVDQRMPKMDGTTATRKIKEMLPKVKVIMATAYDIPEQDRGIFDAVLTKPISSKSLTETVTAVLSKN